MIGLSKRFLDAQNDVAFRRVFGTEKYKDVLIHFLNDMLDFKEDRKIVEASFLKTPRDPDIASKKQSAVDVLCKDEQGDQYIVEMTVAQIPMFQRNARLFADMAFVSQMNKGEALYGVKEIIFLAITDFVMFPEEPGYRSRHATLDAEAFTQGFKDFYFSFLELPKFNKTFDQLENRVDKWIWFLRHAFYTTPEEFDKLVSEDPIFTQAYHALDQFYWTEIELNTYEQEKKHSRDARVILEHQLATREAQGEAKGLAKGKIEGREEGRAESRVEGAKNALLKVAQEMLDDNIPMEKVKAMTKLSDEEIAQLAVFSEHAP